MDATPLVGVGHECSLDETGPRQRSGALQQKEIEIQEIDGDKPIDLNR